MYHIFSKKKSNILLFCLQYKKTLENSLVDKFITDLLINCIKFDTLIFVAFLTYIIFEHFRISDARNVIQVTLNCVIKSLLVFLSLFF